jgi:hypothetical protein
LSSEWWDNWWKIWATSWKNWFPDPTKVYVGASSELVTNNEGTYASLSETVIRSFRKTLSSYRVGIYDLLLIDIKMPLMK